MLSSTKQGASIFPLSDDYRLEPAFHAGEAIVRVAAVEIAIDNLLPIRQSETVLS